MNNIMVVLMKTGTADLLFATDFSTIHESEYTQDQKSKINYLYEINILIIKLKWVLFVIFLDYN